MNTRTIFKAMNFLTDARQVATSCMTNIYTSSLKGQIIGPGNVDIFSASEAKKAELATLGYNSFLDWLPEWSILQGLFSIANGFILLKYEREDVTEEQKIRRQKGIAQISSGGLLVAGGVGSKIALAANVSGSTVLPLLFLTNAINAFVELAIAYDDYCKFRKELESAAYGTFGNTTDMLPANAKMWVARLNVIAKGLTLAGWATLTFGLTVLGPASITAFSLGIWCLVFATGPTVMKCLFQIEAGFFALPVSDDRAENPGSVRQRSNPSPPRV